jgi:cell division protein FtsZ
MGIGSARGDNRALLAAEQAIASPLLEASMEGAHGVLLSISGGSDLGLFEINEAASLVSDAAHADANIIFGAVIDDALGDEVRVTVIAAGLDENRTGRPTSAGAVVAADPGGSSFSSTSFSSASFTPASPARTAAASPGPVASPVAARPAASGAASPGSPDRGTPGPDNTASPGTSVPRTDLAMAVSGGNGIHATPIRDPEPA